MYMIQFLSLIQCANYTEATTEYLVINDKQTLDTVNIETTKINSQHCRLEGWFSLPQTSSVIKKKNQF